MTDFPLGNRILVLGCSGSGKSTFARALRDRTGIPLVHLDLIWWRADRTHISREEFDRTLAGLLRRDKWILDGDYSRTYEVRIRACDTVIFLDFGEDVCMAGIRDRIGKARPDMPWTDERLDPQLEEQVLRYRKEDRPKVYAFLEQYQEKHWLIFRSREEADAWLEGIQQYSASVRSD